MDSIRSFNDLNTYLKKVDFLHKTAEQVVKDFNMSGIDLSLSNDPEIIYKQLFSEVKSLVEQLINSDYKKLMNLLYRIDLDEKKLKSSLEPITVEVLSELIIKRELQKVVSREMFSK